MFKKKELYYPNKEFQNKAWLNNKKIYKEAEKNPVKFWEKLASQLFWFGKWKNPFVHKSPYFQWFVNGKINITSNIFEKNLLGWKNIKNKTALIWEPEPIKEGTKFITYEELFKKVCCLANGLKKLGVKKGDRVGIYLPMILEVIISMLACARIGAVHAVVFSAFSSAALRARLAINEAKILITADGYYRRGQVINLKQSADEGIKPAFTEAPVDVKASTFVDATAGKSAGEGIKIEKVIVVKRVGNKIDWNSEKDIWYEDLIKNESEQCEAEIMDSEDLLFLLATSGSTGIPKQVMHTCGGYTVQTYWTGKWIFDFHKNDIFWCTSDFGWITGHTYTCYSPLLNGITTFIFEGAPDWPNFDRWAQIIEKYKITIFYTAPTAIRMFEKYGAEILKNYNFATLRLLGSVGEPIDEDVWLWYFKNVGKSRCPIVDTWWQTETGGILISSLPGIGP
jgi:acetyl-CoA synthetase